MLDLLLNKRIQQRPTYTRVSQYVTAKIRHGMTWVPPQTPVVHGDGLYEFFGHREMVQKPASIVTVLSWQKDTPPTYEIDIGAAQGVEVGAIYAVYSACPRASLRGQGENETAFLARICITEKRMFRSTGKLLEGNATGIKKGDFAVIEAWALPPPTPIVRLLPAARSPDVRAELERALKGTLLLNLPNQDPVNCKFTVSVSKADIEIRNGRNIRLNRIPKIAADDPERSNKAAHILEHLARFHSTL
ncbi:caspase domain-containing protein [Diplodia corticola]|uniref:Caspase domain-containing protein n=1 Tax=Diplodia corticola TaxID=236234 RepID=A0A1J9S0N8_9PEZI|nr:caspase domain-containing protein [Diplodia corticola]OJD33588.1 caspase domain-containing protein [Diplodia corticola]